MDNHVRSTIYLSGPISLNGTATPEQIKEFIGVFSTHTKQLRGMGFNVINPCDLGKLPSWEAYMRLNIPCVCRSNVVAVLPQWQTSRGSRMEVFIAGELAIPVVEVATLYPDEKA